MSSSRNTAAAPAGLDNRMVCAPKRIGHEIGTISERDNTTSVKKESLARPDPSSGDDIGNGAEVSVKAELLETTKARITGDVTDAQKQRIDEKGDDTQVIADGTVPITGYHSVKTGGQVPSPASSSPTLRAQRATAKRLQ